MASLESLVKFLVGGAAGAVVGLAVGSLLAPQRGEDLQAETRQRLADAKEAGVQAEQETARAIRERFRQRVGDPAALNAATDPVQGPA